MKLSKVAKLFRSIFSAEQEVVTAVSTPTPLRSDVIYQLSEFSDKGHIVDAIPGCESWVIEKDGINYVPLLSVTYGNPSRFKHPIFTNYTGHETKRLAEYLGRPNCVISVKRPGASRPVLFISVEDYIFLFEYNITVERGQQFIRDFAGHYYLSNLKSARRAASKRVSESAPEPVSESAPEPVSEPAPEPVSELATKETFEAFHVPDEFYQAFVTSRVGKMFSEFMEIADSIGLHGHEAAIYADQGVLKCCGRSVLETMGLRGAVRPEDDRRSYTPTELGATMDLSAFGFNKLLERYGLQVRIRNKWQPTELGLPHCAVFDHYVSSSETPSNRLQVKWFKSVLTELASCLDKEDGSLEDAA